MIYSQKRKKITEIPVPHQQPKTDIKNHIVLIPILLLKSDISWYHSKLLHRCIAQGSVHQIYKKTYFLTCSSSGDSFGLMCTCLEISISLLPPKTMEVNGVVLKYHFSYQKWLLWKSIDLDAFIWTRVELSFFSLTICVHRPFNVFMLFHMGS